MSKDRRLSAWRLRVAKKRRNNPKALLGLPTSPLKQPQPPLPPTTPPPLPDKERPLFLQPRHVSSSGNVQLYLPELPPGLDTMCVTLRLTDGRCMMSTVSVGLPQEPGATPVEALLVQVEGRFRHRLLQAFQHENITTVQQFLTAIQTHRQTPGCTDGRSALLFWARYTKRLIGKGLVDDHLVPALLRLGFTLPE